ncbi:carbohydrate ABC transporter permease [Jiangella endophytica]|uniref:carbohydrate ABC transporter permease n=1 Tax=Jiangella endophytica TaxID=1623398 RepID=UPI0018E4F9A6|nr:sugar ABC transporter permease [Jiangella endophytica]
MTSKTMAPKSPTSEVDSGPPSPAAPAPRRRQRIVWWAYLVLAPSIGLLAFFGYYPGLSGFYYSFFDWRPAFESEFVGLENYRRMLSDDVWIQAFGNLGIIFVASVTLMWVLPLLAAELVTSLRSARLQFVFRTLLIVPLAFPGVVTVLLWGFIYDPNTGVLNELLSAVGLDGLRGNWLGDPGSALWALILVQFPWVASLPFLVFLTGLQNIPSEVFEAASVDGTNRWQRFVHIDLPLLFGQVRLLFFLAIVQVLQFGFSAYLLTGGGPDNSTMVPVIRALDMAFGASEWGYAAALSTTLFVLILVLSIAALFVRRSEKGNVDVG